MSHKNVVTSVSSVRFREKEREQVREGRQGIKETSVTPKSKEDTLLRSVCVQLCWNPCERQEARAVFATIKCIFALAVSSYGYEPYASGMGVQRCIE